MLVATLVGCAGAAPGPAGGGRTTLTVFAAASLRGAFTELGDVFEDTHPGAAVSISFAGSQVLAEQLDQGARADVFAAADEPTMAGVVSAGLAAGPPVVFASNRLTIAVPPGNPAVIGSFADLARTDVEVVVCAPVVPCGKATRRAAAAAGVRLSPASEEQAVTDVLAKVQAGEADAGLVYATDARAAGATVAAIDFAESGASITRYPATVLAGAAHPTLAGEFLGLVTGPTGRSVLAAAGFGEP